MDEMTVHFFKTLQIEFCALAKDGISHLAKKDFIVRVEIIFIQMMGKPTR